MHEYNLIIWTETNLLPGRVWASQPFLIIQMFQIKMFLVICLSEIQKGRRYQGFKITLRLLILINKDQIYNGLTTTSTSSVSKTKISLKFNKIHYQANFTIKTLRMKSTVNWNRKFTPSHNNKRNYKGKCNIISKCTISLLKNSNKSRTMRSRKESYKMGISLQESTIQVEVKDRDLLKKSCKIDMKLMLNFRTKKIWSKGSNKELGHIHKGT